MVRKKLQPIPGDKFGSRIEQEKQIDAIKTEVQNTGGMSNINNLPPPQRENVFAPTKNPDEPVTSGLPFGPGMTGYGQESQAKNKAIEMERVKQFVYNSWLETGDDSLLEFI